MVVLIDKSELKTICELHNSVLMLLKTNQHFFIIFFAFMANNNAKRHAMRI